MVLNLLTCAVRTAEVRSLNVTQVSQRFRRPRDGESSQPVHMGSINLVAGFSKGIDDASANQQENFLYKSVSIAVWKSCYGQRTFILKKMDSEQTVGQVSHFVAVQTSLGIKSRRLDRGHSFSSISKQRK